MSEMEEWSTNKVQIAELCRKCQEKVERTLSKQDLNVHALVGHSNLLYSLLTEIVSGEDKERCSSLATEDLRDNR